MIKLKKNQFKNKQKKLQDLTRVNPPNSWTESWDWDSFIKSKLKNNQSQPELTCQARNWDNSIKNKL